MKQLIVNADDLGRAPGIDRGIVRAHREGIVTSATLIANAPGAESASTLTHPGVRATIDRLGFVLSTFADL